MTHRHGGSRPILSPTRTLMPGDLFCERQPHRLGTVLGSCVAVCLWDRQLQFGGMNHFLLPTLPPNVPPSLRFGDVAIPELVHRMVTLGSSIRHLQAKVFGGACVLNTASPEDAVGRRNADLALAELCRLGVPVVASRISGTRGLVIRQCTACGDVWVRPVGIRPGSVPSPFAGDAPPVESEAAEGGVMVLDARGLPVAVHRRAEPPKRPRAWCRTCTTSPYGWQKT